MARARWRGPRQADAVLFPATTWPGLASGEITVAFRSWKRPMVKVGGTLITAAGQLAIHSVQPVDPSAITEEDAHRAGAADADEIRGGRSRRRRAPDVPGGLPPRGRGPADRAAGVGRPSATTAAELRRKLAGYDQRSPTGPWTTATLEAIRDRPAVVSTELAEALGIERPPFKLNVRKLKALGLTESLEVGYRLSPAVPPTSTASADLVPPAGRRRRHRSRPISPSRPVLTWVGSDR